VSHPTLNHKPLPTSKNILTPMREGGVRPCGRNEILDPTPQISVFGKLKLRDCVR
jgi:hypothetical protein